MSEAMVMFCTCPDEQTAEKLARGMVEGRLAACVNVLPGIRSIYRWQGAVNEDAEALLVVKTTAEAYARLEPWVRQNHPYDVPEIIAVDINTGSAEYLAWIRSGTVAEKTGNEGQNTS